MLLLIQFEILQTGIILRCAFAIKGRISLELIQIIILGGLETSVHRQIFLQISFLKSFTFFMKRNNIFGDEEQASTIYQCDYYPTVNHITSVQDGFFSEMFFFLLLL